MADQNHIGETSPRRRPARPYEARQWMEDEARVECFSASDPTYVMHEGWIIGMTEAPTVYVLKDDGQVVTWVLGITRRQQLADTSPRKPRVWTEADRDHEPDDCTRVMDAEGVLWWFDEEFGAWATVVRSSQSWWSLTRKRGPLTEVP